MNATVKFCVLFVLLYGASVGLVHAVLWKADAHPPDWVWVSDGEECITGRLVSLQGRTVSQTRPICGDDTRFWLWFIPAPVVGASDD